MIGALVGIGFQMAQEMFTNFGLVAGLPPLAIAFVPALAAFAAVLVMFRRTRLA
jgi:lipopolysaccharide export LptBFGC system permease protein LptF